MNLKPNSLGAKLVVGGIVAFVVLSVAALLYGWATQPRTTLMLGDGVFKAELAITPEKRAKGWAGVEDISSERAIILAFPYEAKWEVVTQDMKTDIDIVWLDQYKEVVHMVKEAPPVVFNDESFEPLKTALFVVELPAGTIDNRNIHIGAKAEFKHDQGDVR
jgi:uncharacterized membrane protein (UPF0127 family)